MDIHTLSLEMLDKSQLIKPHTRRPHRKTKTGCLSCKRRKIKCDEARPECGNCIKHSLECEYGPKKQIGLSGAGQLLPANGAAELNLFDLELLHFFCTSTATSYHHNPIGRRVMSINVPQLGFSHDFVMHGILALAALHLAKTSPERRERCIEQAVLHHQTGLKKASVALPAIDKDNCSALYIFSALTLLYTLASTTLHKSDNFILIGEAGIAEWIILSRQSYSIVRVAGDALRAGPLGPIFSAGARRAALQGEHKAISEGAERLGAILAHIDQSTPDPNHREAYSQAISELIKIYGVLEYLIKEDLPRETSDIFIWPYKLSDRYLDLLQQPTQEALAILSFFAVLPLQFEQHWFLEDFSHHLISKIYPLIDKDYLSWIQWPLQEIGWKPEVSEVY